jgi:hypothetical protein
VDAAGFAQTAVTAGTVTVAAPFTAPAVSITRMPVSLVSDQRAQGPLVLLLSDDGNVPITGPVTITVYATASGAIDDSSVKIITVKPKLAIAAGKGKSIAMQLGKLPALASGTYQLGVTIAVPAVGGAAAASAMGISTATFDVA